MSESLLGIFHNSEQEGCSRTYEARAERERDDRVADFEFASSCAEGAEEPSRVHDKCVGASIRDVAHAALHVVLVATSRKSAN